MRASSDGTTMGLAVLLVAIGLVGVLGALVVGVAFAASRFTGPSSLDLVVLLPRVVTAPGAPPRRSAGGPLWSGGIAPPERAPR